MDNKDVIRVILVDDHAILREGLASLLNSEEDIAVVGQAGNGRECLGLIDGMEPDVVILDINMLGISGIDTCRLIKERHPGVHVVILSMYEDEEYVRRALAAGSDGYLLKEIVSSELIAAVRSAAKGERVLSAPVLEKIIDDYSRGDGKDTVEYPMRELTNRQMRILDLISAGKRNREIASELYVSEKTVEKDISVIYCNLRVSSRTEAVALYHRIMGLDRFSIQVLKEETT